jgi:hypothetical protein
MPLFYIERQSTLGVQVLTPSDITEEKARGILQDIKAEYEEVDIDVECQYQEDGRTLVCKSDNTSFMATYRILPRPPAAQT